MKIKELATLLDDQTELDIIHAENLGQRLFENLIGEEVMAQKYKDIPLGDYNVDALWVDEDRGYNLTVVIDDPETNTIKDFAKGIIDLSRGGRVDVSDIVDYTKDFLERRNIE